MKDVDRIIIKMKLATLLISTVATLKVCGSQAHAQADLFTVTQLRCAALRWSPPSKGFPLRITSINRKNPVISLC